MRPSSCSTTPNLDAAVQGALAAKYRNTGQACGRGEPDLVQSGVYEAFAARLAEETAKLNGGQRRRAGVVQGPLIQSGSRGEVEEHIADAVARAPKSRPAAGATSWGQLLRADVLTDVPKDALIFNDETFGLGRAAVSGSRPRPRRSAWRTTRPTASRSYFLFARCRSHLPASPGRWSSAMVGVNEGFISDGGRSLRGGVKAVGAWARGLQVTAPTTTSRSST